MSWLSRLSLPKRWTQLQGDHEPLPKRVLRTSNEARNWRMRALRSIPAHHANESYIAMHPMQPVRMHFSTAWLTPEGANRVECGAKDAPVRKPVEPADLDLERLGIELLLQRF